MTKSPTPTQTAATELDPKALAIGVYALYLAAFLTGVTALAGVILAYLMRGDAPEWLKSHYEFQIRTFWIALAGTIVGGATVWLLGIGLLILLGVALWFLVRTVAGLSQLMNSRPYPNPKGWGI